MKILCVVLIPIVLISIINCSEDFWCDDDCNEEYDDRVSKYDDDPGECTVSSWSDGTWCKDCWWWDRGVNRTFCQWDACGCDISTFTFNPIYSVYTDETKNNIIEYEYNNDSIKFSQPHLLREKWVISFATNIMLKESPAVFIVTDSESYICKVEYSVHDSGLITGYIFVPEYENINVLYFNDHIINWE